MPEKRACILSSVRGSLATLGPRIRRTTSPAGPPAITNRNNTMPSKSKSASKSTAGSGSAAALGSRPLPIYGTDIDKHPAELVEEVRNELARLRGKLYDVHRAYPLWKDWLDHVEGGITCLLVTLADSRKEMVKHRERWGHKRPWVKDENG